MDNNQPGIMADVPRHARYLFFSLLPEADPGQALRSLAGHIDESRVVGLGLPLIERLQGDIEGLRTFPAHSGTGFSIPSTPSALWIWLRGDDRGELLHRSRELSQQLADTFRLDKAIDAFQYLDSRDLTGYEDGTENPEGEAAISAAVVRDKGEGLDGASFVAVQQWVHDLDHFQSMPQEERDNTIGRRISDNEEIEGAPESAHVKRTAQEDFQPEAFVLRRSMPWADETEAGLVFVAFGHSLDAFEALLDRMLGKDDGITDALFNFTRPVTGSYFWCPPVTDGRLDLSRLSL